MYFALRRRGVPAKMIQYAGQPHGIAGSWNNVHRMINELQWWEKYLKTEDRRRETGDRIGYRPLATDAYSALNRSLNVPCG
jgi:hypothetical protein